MTSTSTLSFLLMILLVAVTETTSAFVVGRKPSSSSATAFVCTTQTTTRTTTTTATATNSALYSSKSVDKMSLDEMKKEFLDGISEDEVDFTGIDRNPDAGLLPLIALTEDNAIKCRGFFKDTTSEADTIDLKRYTQMHELSEEQVQTLFAHTNAKIIAKGVGEEWYEIPKDGKGTATTEYSAEDAVKEALAVAESANGSPRIVINVFGGDDLVLVEVTDALETLVKKLKDVPAKATILWNSMAHDIVEEETCWLTVVAMNDIDNDGAVLPEDLKGPLKNAAEGEVYFARGKYWTTSEDDTVTEKDYDPEWYEEHVVNREASMIKYKEQGEEADDGGETIEAGEEDFAPGYGAE